MENDENSKPHDLEDRTFQFAKSSRVFVKLLRRTIANIEDVKQFVRASGSVGANYIEANEAIGKKRLCHENQDLPPGSERELLLTWVIGSRWQT
jgi:four helix bundle protein